MGYMDKVTDLGSVFGTATGGGSMNPMAALGGLAGEAASAWYGNRMAQQRQREAYGQQLTMMQNRYQMQTKDMMAAGLNPMLATSQGAPMPGGVGQAQTNKPDLVQAISNAMVSTAQSGKIKQETENLKTENENLKNTAVLLQKQTSKTEAEIEEIDQKIKTGKATEAEINRKTELMEIQKELVRVQIELGVQERKLKHPEEIASGTQGAEISAIISRTLKPLIDMLSGAARIK